MRIVRYPLEICDYQQVQPLWPGQVLSVAPGRDLDKYGEQGIDMWALDNDTNRGDRPAPVLGVWIVGTGNPMPPALIAADALFHGTCVMKNLLVWHVFSAVIGKAATPEKAAPPTFGTVDDMLERIKEAHHDRRR